MGKRYLRGVIHCHSRYSHDSLVSIATYLRVAAAETLDFIILTDHDTTAGARELRAAAARCLPSLQVPIAAEYLTDEGDVIAAFIEHELKARKFPDFVKEARASNALLLLPHPYVGHRAPEKIAAECDLVEVLNCRTKPSRNQRADELAKFLGKRGFAGSDAHFACSIGSALLEVENLGSLRTSILNGSMRWAPPRMTSHWEFGLSQLIKSWKRRDPALALRLLRQAGGRLMHMSDT